MQPRRGAFQVMAHQRLSSRGETKEPFCSQRSSLSTLVTIEPCSSFLWAQKATLKFIMTSGKKDKGQVRLQRNQAEPKSGGAQIYTYAFFFCIGFINNSSMLWVLWSGGLKCLGICVSTPSFFSCCRCFQANTSKVAVLLRRSKYLQLIFRIPLGLRVNIYIYIYFDFFTTQNIHWNQSQGCLQNALYRHNSQCLGLFFNFYSGSHH